MADQDAPELHGALAPAPGAEEDSQQLGIGQRGGPPRGEFLAWTIRLGQIPDAGGEVGRRLIHLGNFMEDFAACGKWGMRKKRAKTVGRDRKFAENAVGSVFLNTWKK